METTKLKRFAQHARTTLIDTVKTKLDFVLADDSSAKREHPQAVEKLEAEIKKTSQEQVIEKVAYIWFNRFIALRFMDVNRYSKLNIVSPEPGQFQPSILSDAKMGHVDKNLVSESIKEKVLALLENRTPSDDSQGEAYKLLVVATCNYYAYSMPFLFERIADYTELLMPDDLLSGDSILSYVREAMTPDVCKDVEVIGWLYQFYISEKKDKVFDGIKKNKKVTPENIPAATQLFTPHWIVQYMVENSLGRLWMLNNPNSPIASKMEYYIKPETPEDDYLKITKPQELKVCDPACGSGHILVYAFDLLFDIYKDAGFTDDDEIIKNILEHNLYGIEIDERAAELAAFALAMKAADRSTISRMFFEETIEVNICRLQNISFSAEEKNSYMDAVGRDLFTTDLQTTLSQFEEADNFGSLIQPAVKDVTATLQTLKENKKVTQDMFLAPTHEKVLQVLEQADYLSQKYHVVVANPPYMGGKGINGRLGVFLKENFEDVKSDLFSAFVVRCGNLGIDYANIGIMSPNVWMYIASYEKLRYYILQTKSLTSLVELPLTGFKGATVQICSYTFINHVNNNLEATFIRLVDFKGGDHEMAQYAKQAIVDKDCKYCYSSSSKIFEKVPGFPIAYSASSNALKSFDSSKSFEDYATPRQGLGTTNNDLFTRTWSEISIEKIYFNSIDKYEALKSQKKWFPYSKGGGFRKWFGNDFDVVNWENDGEAVKKYLIGKNPNIPRSETHYFKEAITWGLITSAKFSARYSPKGGIFDVGGSKAFPKHEHNPYFLGLLNSKLSEVFLKTLNPTLNFQVGDLKRIPIVNLEESLNNITSIVKQCVESTKADWDSYETSWAFKILPLLNFKDEDLTLEEVYKSLSLLWETEINKVKKLEEESNNIFIKAYGLEDELTEEVPIKEITLTCNPYYRYDAKKSKEELDELQLADTMKEYISYAVGVMLGRYSLDHDGLHIADVDVSVDEANAKFNIQVPSFEADDDNVIPILDGDWFTDDISERFLQFVKVTFGDESYEENVQFIEDAIGKSIRKYFVKDFYPDHIKRYKKRPIYWMFSSSKGSFQALIYMHRYKSDTVSVILNDYLRDYITKIEATKENLEATSISSNATTAEKNKALREIEKLKKTIVELVDYERDILYPLATEKIEIDLDDGVKHNYPLFGKALKKVAGLS